VRKKTGYELVNVRDLVNEIVGSIVPRDFKVVVGSLPTIVTERLKLEQVFANLISNAVKYTATDTGEIVIDCKELSDRYEFSVKDNGIGIDPEYHEKVFEIFQTLREKGERESTGIGLAIVKKILEDQHCTISIQSSAGEGAAFIFNWPKQTKL